jgi:hypothetical protein
LIIQKGYLWFWTFFKIILEISCSIFEIITRVLIERHILRMELPHLVWKLIKEQSTNGLSKPLIAYHSH